MPNRTCYSLHSAKNGPSRSIAQCQKKQSPEKRKVKKRYDRLLQYCFQPRLKRDVSAYIKKCCTCHLAGKPTQAVKQPFEHLTMLGCCLFDPFKTGSHLFADCHVPSKHSLSTWNKKTTKSNDTIDCVWDNYWERSRLQFPILSCSRWSHKLSKTHKCSALLTASTTTESK